MLTSVSGVGIRYRWRPRWDVGNVGKETSGGAGGREGAGYDETRDARTIYWRGSCSRWSLFRRCLRSSVHTGGEERGALRVEKVRGRMTQFGTRGLHSFTYHLNLSRV